MEGRFIKKIKALAGSQKFDFEVSFFIDTTGDGNLFYMTGCDYELGRKSDR